MDRPALPFRQRLALWWWQYLIAEDQLWGVRISFVTFVLLGRGSVWKADETISSRVGRNALQGKRWALVCQTIINWIFSPFERDHCFNAIEWDELGPGLRARLRGLRHN